MCICSALQKDSFTLLSGCCDVLSSLLFISGKTVTNQASNATEIRSLNDIIIEELNLNSSTGHSKHTLYIIAWVYFTTIFFEF